MAYRKHHILGVHAPGARPTIGAALLLAVALCVPVSVAMVVADMLF